VCVGGEGEGEGKVVEQHTGALGNPRSSFSSSSSSLCIRRGFDKNFTLGSAVQVRYYEKLVIYFGVSVADPGCLSRIPDPKLFNLGSRVKKIPYPDHRILSIFNPKNCL
jgi:hypothetical protein